MNGETGLLPDIEIEQFIAKNIIRASTKIEKSQIQPSSLDLRLGDVAYRIRASFLPGKNFSVAEKLEHIKLHSLDLSKGAVLETNCVYIVPLQERLELPSNISALGNPKSSTGRLDIFTRLISDYSQKFDVIEKNYKGALYLEISPHTFPIIVHAGSKLSQLRFRKNDVKPLSASELAKMQQKYNRYYHTSNNEVMLSVDLTGNKDGLIGYKAKKHTNVIDVNKLAFYPINDFWEPIHKDKNYAELILDPQQFYILASYENVFIPSEVAAEMVAFDPLVGEFRAHYAGFFDPGFGAGAEINSKAVLEVRSFDIPFILEHKQIIGKLIFEPMCSKPRHVYGSQKGSNYQAQQLKLSKHFY